MPKTKQAEPEEITPEARGYLEQAQQLEAGRAALVARAVLGGSSPVTWCTTGDPSSL